MSEPDVYIAAADDPGAAALNSLTRSLWAISSGKTGASPAALIAQGGAMIKRLRPATHVAWAAQSVAAADFWAAAAHFQPHLVEQERLAREALKAGNVTVNRVPRPRK